ncbi:hypothetical protein HZH68_010499 [Vespula germanica]|uniref:Uncharacterized protein n=1 Tax=Vespula germanica TaxID=30212 RepID=A0A834N2R7_VESGE|nr:hypothetical protein HZH68_010499 [Vespula germanica]
MLAATADVVVVVVAAATTERQPQEKETGRLARGLGVEGGIAGDVLPRDEERLEILGSFTSREYYTPRREHSPIRLAEHQCTPQAFSFPLPHEFRRRDPAALFKRLTGCLDSKDYGFRPRCRGMETGSPRHVGLPRVKALPLTFEISLRYFSRKKGRYSVKSSKKHKDPSFVVDEGKANSKLLFPRERRRHRWKAYSDLGELASFSMSSRLMENISVDVEGSRRKREGQEEAKGVRGERRSWGASGGSSLESAPRRGGWRVDGEALESRWRGAGERMPRKARRRACAFEVDRLPWGQIEVYPVAKRDEANFGFIAFLDEAVLCGLNFILKPLLLGYFLLVKSIETRIVA